MTVSTAFAPNRVARGVAIKTEHKNLGGSGTRYRPVRIPVMAQGAEGTTYSTDKRQVFSAAEAGSIYGYDSPIYQAVLSLLPPNGDGVGDIPVTIYPLAAPAGVQAIHDITPSGTQTKSQTYYVKVNNQYSLSIDMVASETVADWIAKAIAAINGVLGMPGTASDGTTKLDFTAGWKGTTGNDIVLEVEGPVDAEMSFVVDVDTAGTGTASVTAALAAIGSVWETHIINGNLYTDSTLLDEFSTYNEGRWDPEVRKPLRVYTGTNEATLATVTAVTDARKTDRTNVILTNPGSNDLPIVIAADQVRRIARLANLDPPHDYGSQRCPRLTPGPDSSQWKSSQRQTAVTAGTSTIEVKDGVVNISDVVTCYHPTGEEPPPYRFDVDLEKIATMIYNTDLIFNNSEWDGAPLVPDNQAVKNPSAKKPKMAMAAINALYDTAAADAIISDPDFAKENSTAGIDDTNPKRLNVKMVFKLSGNANVISIDLNFGFHYGS